MIAQLESLLGGGLWAVLKLVVGLLMIAEGFLLATDWRRARRETTARVLVRLGRRRFWRFLLGPLLLVYGLAAVGFGCLEVVRAAQNAF